MHRKLLQMLIDAIKRTFHLLKRNSNEQRLTNLHLLGDGTLKVNKLHEANNQCEPEIIQEIHESICVPRFGPIVFDSKGKNQKQNLFTLKMTLCGHCLNLVIILDLITTSVPAIITRGRFKRIVNQNKKILKQKTKRRKSRVTKRRKRNRK